MGTDTETISGQGQWNTSYSGVSLETVIRQQEEAHAILLAFMGQEKREGQT